MGLGLAIRLFRKLKAGDLSPMLGEAVNSPHDPSVPTYKLGNMAKTMNSHSIARA